MNTINYQELRELYLASTEKLYFPYTNAAHANPTNIISCYRLCSDQNLDFLIILKSGYDESLFLRKPIVLPKILQKMYFPFSKICKQLKAKI